ncbi:MAG: hypothetical protein EBU90_20540 [Proteobacteria bacterium]|nr:hypothetical protein [Pseudomonadota bacterium]
MATANSSIQFADLDFADIKSSLIDYLKSQETFKDYNFTGSSLSILLDILAYNTQYNAYYLNMVGNEMFLDTALQRSSVVSQAKVLNYTPKSAIAPSATINLTAYGVSTSLLTLPKFTKFISESIDGVNYIFVNDDAYTVSTLSGQADFVDVTLKQGTPVSYSFTVDTTANPDLLFEIPDDSIDTTTLQVTVQESGTNSSSTVYTQVTDVLYLDGTSTVYFLQEGINGNYEIYFGDGILGKKLIDGNIVRLNYLSTNGTAAAGANSFVLLDSISGFSNTSISSITPATSGGEKESIDSIKFQAPKSYASQNRAVSKNDYITLIQQNNLGYSFDAVNVWGGQENDPPVYGQVFVAIKPTGAYLFTDAQKERIIQDVIKPISVLTVEPTLVDPDYTYIKITANALYDPKKTTLTAAQIQNKIKSAIVSVTDTSLNTFNSTFLATDINDAISASDPSIITNELSIQVQKKFYPTLTVPSSYKLYFGTKLEKGMFQSGITSSPAMDFRDPENLSNTLTNVYIEELPSSTGGVESISILNPGIKYQKAPKITITGDGSGATAIATINPNGTIKAITVTNKGSNYTSAVVTITAAAGDTTGSLGVAIANIEGRYGTLQTYYYNTKGVKTILNSVGTVDYMTGLVELNSFNPLNVNNDLGELTITANPVSTIISSTYNRIITVDPFDSNAIIVNLTAKSS